MALLFFLMRNRRIGPVERWRVSLWEGYCACLPLPAVKMCH